MKRAFLSIMLGVAATLCFAQNYEPTTTWPYLNDDFQAGQIVGNDGKNVKGLYNVHLLHGRLHFIEGDMIREVSPAEVSMLYIGKDVYRNVGGTMMEVLAQSENGFVVRKYEVDVVRMNSTGGAYGSSSSTLATQNVSSLDAIGATGVSVNHMNLKNSKDDGSTLPLIKKTYLVFGGNVVYASKKDVLDVPGVDKDAFNVFLKENRIKWKDPQSLIMVLDFISNGLKDK